MKYFRKRRKCWKPALFLKYFRKRRKCWKPALFSFPQCLKNLLSFGRENQGLFWKCLNRNDLWYYYTYLWYEYQSVGNAGVAFVRGANERNEFFGKDKQTVICGLIINPGTPFDSHGRIIFSYKVVIFSFII